MQGLLNNGLGRGLIFLAVACALSALLTPLGIRLAWRLGIVDRPVGDKIHARPTPLMGGVAIVVAFIAVTFIYQFPLPHNMPLLGLLLGCALAALLGFCDEKWKLSPRVHFLGQVAVVLVAVAAQFPVISRISNPLHGISLKETSSVYLSALLGFEPLHATHDGAPQVTFVLGLLFTVFWIVGMMNTVNFLDGLDGLAGGVSAISALFLGLWALVITQTGYAPGKPTFDNQNVILPLILCGAILGFLLFNWAPARVFMGDSGAMFIGFALGALSLFGPVKLGTALLLLIIPIMDVAWAIVRRLLGRRSFASGDKHHIYHRMLELGLSRRAVVLIFYALVSALGVVDLFLHKQAKLIAFVAVAVLVAAVAVQLELRGRRAEARAAKPSGDYHLPAPKP